MGSESPRPLAAYKPHEMTRTAVMEIRSQPHHLTFLSLPPRAIWSTLDGIATGLSVLDAGTVGVGGATGVGTSAGVGIVTGVGTVTPVGGDTGTLPPGALTGRLTNGANVILPLTGAVIGAMV